MFGTASEVFGLSPDMIRFSIKNPGSCRKKKSHTLGSKKGWQVYVCCVCKYMLVALASLFIWCFTIFSGCSKCFKKFPRASFGDKPDFSGFDRESWEPRASEDHQAAAEKVRQDKTP